MDGFAGEVDRVLHELRELFGSASNPIASSVTDPLAPARPASWSGESGQTYAAAAGTVTGGSATLQEADAALDEVHRAVAASTAAGRGRLDELIAASRAAAASLGPQTGSVPAAVALVHTLSDHLAQASRLTVEQAEQASAYRRQLEALTAEFTSQAGPPR